MKLEKHILRLIIMLIILTAVPFCHGKCVEMTSEIVTFYFGVETPVPDPSGKEIIDNVHTDIDTPFLCDFNGCDWKLEISPNDQPFGADRQIDPNQALLYVNSNVQVQMPSNTNFSFIGAIPGETIWVLPQSYKPNVLELGFSSAAMTQQVKDSLCDPVFLEVQLVDVRGPGYFSLWYATSPSDAEVYFASYGGITEDDVYSYPVGAHRHLNWGFTQPGFYEVDLEVSTFYECSNMLYADVSGDCQVDLEDAGLLSSVWLEENCTDPNMLCYDIDLHDPNQVDLTDFSLMIYQWLECGTPFQEECL